MSNIKFNDILASLADEYDANEREQLFDKIEQLETDDDAINGVKLFIEKNGRDYDKIRNTFKSFATLLEEKEKKYYKNQSLNWFKYAAILIAVSAAAIYFTLFYNKTNENLSAFEYNEIGLPVLMSNTNNTDFNNAMSSFKMHEYKKAFTQFNMLPITDTTSYFKGVCQYQMGNLNNAVEELHNINEASVFYEKSLYHLSLCYFKLGNKSEAINTLHKLLGTNNEFKLKAKELFEFINK